MKKISLALIIFALAFSLGGVSFAQEDQSASKLDLVKIPSPDMIKYYKNVRKVGNSLMGVLKEKKDDNTAKKSVKATSTIALEKIINLTQLKNFEKVQKIGSSLYGIRKNPVKDPAFVTAEAATCVKVAIDKKDAAIKASVTVRSGKILAAIDARSACQKLALDKTTALDQSAAIKTCAKNFQNTVEDVDKVRVQAGKDSWKIYVADLKSCSTTSNIEIEDGGSLADTSAL